MLENFVKRANTPLVSSTNCYIQRTVPLQSKWMVYARLMIAKSGSLQSAGGCGGGWRGFLGDILPGEGKIVGGKCGDARK